jgi:hypothetical protein
MADVSIDATIDTETARGMRALVFVSANTGYAFYIDSAGNFVYNRTLDGGASWAGAITIGSATTCVAFDVWYDRWTPGDTGSLIHVWFFDPTADDILYATLDVRGGPNLSPITTAITLSSAVAGRGAFVSGTKTRSGYLYVAFDIDAGAERGLYRSTDDGASWGSTLSATFVEATLDTCKLFPASGTGDDNDCWAVYYDASALALTLKLWDSSAASATESATIGVAHTDGATDLTGQFGYDAMVRHSDGHLILVKQSTRDVAAGTHQVFDITSTASIATKTAIVSSGDDHYYPQIFIDQGTDTLYVAYNGKRDGSEVLDTTTKVYYTKSTDGGTTWSAGDTAYMEGAAGIVLQVWTPKMGHRFCAMWRVAGTLNFNKVNSLVKIANPAGAVESATPSFNTLASFISSGPLTGVVTVSSIGGASSQTRSQAQTFTAAVSGSLKQVRAYCGKFNSPADHVRVELWEGSPTVGTSTVGTTLLATSEDESGAGAVLVSHAPVTLTTWEFAEPLPTITASSTYTLRWVRTGAASDANYYTIGANIDGLYSNGQLYTQSASTGNWSTPGAVADVVGDVIQTGAGLLVLDAVTAVLVNVGPINKTVSETITVTEDVKAVLTPLAVHAAETLTITESAAFTTSPILRNVSEAITVADAPRVGLNLGKVVSDAITGTPWVTVAILDERPIQVTDSVTAELITFVPSDLNASVHDTITVTEFVKAVVTPLAVHAADAITVTELQRVGNNLGKVVNDTITVTELQRVGLNLGKVVNDAITVLDALRVGNNLGKVVNDVITVAESQRVGRNLGVVVSDAVAVTELQRVGNNLGLVKSETISVLDARRVGLNLGKVVSESITATDSATRVITPLIVRVHEVITVAESQSLLLVDVGALAAMPSETVAVLDVARVVVTPLGARPADAITLAESVKAVVTPLAVHAAETITVTEARTAQCNVVRLTVLVADAITTSESVKPVIPVLSGRAIETLTVAEQLTARVTPLVAAVSDDVAVTDVVATFMFTPPTGLEAADLITVTDGAAGALSAIVHFVTVEIRAEGSRVHTQGLLSGRVGSGGLRRVPSLAGGTIRRLNSLATRASETVAVQDHVTVALE